MVYSVDILWCLHGILYGVFIGYFMVFPLNILWCLYWIFYGVSLDVIHGIYWM